MAKSPYDKADIVIKYLSTKLMRLFSRTFAFDELNVINVSYEIYDEAYELILREAARLTKTVYEMYLGEDADAEGLGLDALAFALAMAKAYNPVTKYVFENELDRKRAKFAEGVIATDTKEAEKAGHAQRLVRMTVQYIDDVTFAAGVQALKDMGVKRVKWVTNVDDRRCPTCRSKHGKIFSIYDVPAKPHMGCRCWIEAVD